MGGGKAVKHDLPHYSKWQIKDYPKFIEYQRQLDEAGLKDPWIRNHLWKCTNPLRKNYALPVTTLFLKGGTIFQGMRYGLATTVAFIIGHQTLTRMGYIEDHGHH